MDKIITMWEVYPVVPNEYGWGAIHCRLKSEAEGHQARLMAWTNTPWDIRKVRKEKYYLYED